MMELIVMSLLNLLSYLLMMIIWKKIINNIKRKKQLITKIKGKAFLRLSMYSILKKFYN